MSKEKDKNPVGRPTVMTEETIRKLEQAFSIGCTDLEACQYAEISKSTFYDYLNENPEFSDRKEALKKKPILKARQVVINNLDNIETARWYLERKVKDEFSTRVENEMSGTVDLPVIIDDIPRPANMPEKK